MAPAEMFFLHAQLLTCYAHCTVSTLIQVQPHIWPSLFHSIDRLDHTRITLTV
ncbi:hypothetical protein M758_UG018000 [Ceratodon purpureus]|nr:hypothetical protein M758_UG018000 [Ceratodon purpureus]